jgi:hypothetical protein
VSYKTYRYRVLCEDKRQYYFVQSYLCCKGANNRKIQPFGLPNGVGDAKQFVEENYPNALKAVRKNEKEILIVVRDADGDDYDDVIKKFDGHVSFIVVPKRHIETWYYYLDNPKSPEANDEVCERKEQYERKGVKPTRYGKKLELAINEMRQGRTPSNMPPSLLRTIHHLIECESSKQVV